MITTDYKTAVDTTFTGRGMFDCFRVIDEERGGLRLYGRVVMDMRQPPFVAGDEMHAFAPGWRFWATGIRDIGEDGVAI